MPENVSNSLGTMPALDATTQKIIAALRRQRDAQSDLVAELSVRVEVLTDHVKTLQSSLMELEMTSAQTLMAEIENHNTNLTAAQKVITELQMRIDILEVQCEKLTR